MLNKFLDILPPGPAMFFAAIFFIMPILPEPHLVQKAMMLSEGLTLKPIDWFDIVVHTLGGVLAVLIWRRQRQVRAQAAQHGDRSTSDSEDDRA